MVQKSFDKKPIFFHQSAVLTWKMPPSASPHRVETQDIPTSPENNSITSPDMVARSVKSNDEKAKSASLGSYAVGFWFIDGPSFVYYRSHLIQRILSYGASHGGIYIMILGLVCAMASGIVRWERISRCIQDPLMKFQALPLMNIVFGQLVGSFNEYFIPGSGITEQSFKSSVNQDR